jgi:hypothetical protein
MGWLNKTHYYQEVGKLSGHWREGNSFNIFHAYTTEHSRRSLSYWCNYATQDSWVKLMNRDICIRRSFPRVSTTLALFPNAEIFSTTFTLVVLQSPTLASDRSRWSVLYAASINAYVNNRSKYLVNRECKVSTAISEYLLQYYWMIWH